MMDANGQVPPSGCGSQSSETECTHIYKSGPGFVNICFLGSTTGKICSTGGVMDNVAFLTSGNAVYSKKRAKKRGGLEELAFDPEERRCLHPILS
jgi:hypothetical protein